ncbi:leiomodin-1 isoform X2 [Clupea harengus]|uniref:Leiomodin-1 n=1 Tax=Clupea harengus TaxID=7950 RepID=A0A6P8F5M0_CLUHA|nr:leiomodin-1 isoform X2 [Clupea harengus]
MAKGDGKSSRKQEYLRKMGWSQEKKEYGGVQRQDSDSCSQENQTEARSSRGPAAADGPKEEPTGAGPTGAGPTHRRRREESRDAEVKGERASNEKPTDRRDTRESIRASDRRDTRESIGGSSSSISKTKELISKLQEKKEESRETERKEEVRKKDDSKMKGLISKMEEKREKEENMERLRKEEARKRDDSKTKGPMSKMEDRQSPNEANKTEDRKRSEPKDKTDAPSEGAKEDGGEKVEKKKDGQGKEVKNEGMENEVKTNETMKVKANGERMKPSVNEKGEDEEQMEKAAGETAKLTPSKKEALGNCVAEKTPKLKTKTKEEEEEEESASMFDETMQKVRDNDSNMTELNVNNSEVIKAKTLIQFAEALRDNTHIKTFALANCRADDHIAYAIAGTLRVNNTLTSINLDSNLLTSKGIMALVQALQRNATLTELRFHNQRHICGGKSEMEMTKLLKDNTTLLKLGYHFELAGPRMTMTNILSRNMDRQRQRRLQEQKQAQANGDQKGALDVPRVSGGFRSPRASPRPSPQPSPMPSPKTTPKMTPKKGGGPPGPGGPPPPPPPPPPPAPMMDGDFLKNSLTPVSQRRVEDRAGSRGDGKNTRDQLLASIRGNNMKQLKKVAVPKLLQ